MSSIETETAVLDRVRSNMIADGYDVVIHPSKLQLPEFLQGLRPDAIATRGSENVLIEVVSRSKGTEDKVRRYREAISGHSDWTLRTVWTSGHTVPTKLAVPSRKDIERRLRDIKILIEQESFDAAMLLSWATLEGAARKLIGSPVERPQSPRRLIEQLEKHAFVSRDDAKYLRELSDLRNRLIHGDLAVSISHSQADRFLSALTRVVS